MIRIGLTGGIGCGKSTVARWLLERGIPVIDTDDVARELVEPGSEALAAIVQGFGNGFLKPDGTLDRGSLGRLVFADPNARADLESILHPRIHRAWKERLETLESQSRERAVVVIPLLYEKGYQREFDAVVAVACSVGSQRERLRQRGWSDPEIEARNAAQWPMQAKVEAAGKVLWSEGRLECLHEQLARVFGNLGLAS